MPKPKPRVQIGTVETLRNRVYPMPGSTLGAAETVLVEPGVYPIFLEGGLVFWEMDGKLNRVEAETEMISGRPGDSLNLMTVHDAPEGQPVRTQSRPVTPEKFRAMVAYEHAQPDTAFTFTLDRPL